AHAGSNDLISWGPQSYPYLEKGKNVLKPVIAFDKNSQNYRITYTDSQNRFFQTTTRDFKKYTSAEEVPPSQYQSRNISIWLGGEKHEGQLHRVSWTVVDALLKSYQLQQYNAALNAE